MPVRLARGSGKLTVESRTYDPPAVHNSRRFTISFSHTKLDAHAVRGRRGRSGISIRSADADGVS